MGKEEIRELRLKMGLGVIEFGDYFGVSRQAVYHWESGKYIPNPVLAYRLKKAQRLFDENPEKFFRNPRKWFAQYLPCKATLTLDNNAGESPVDLHNSACPLPIKDTS